MTIEPINFNLQPVETPLLKTSISYAETDSKQGVSFASTLGNALKNLKEVHKEAALAMQDYSAGKKNLDITEVMMTFEKSQIATDLAIQIRNKFIEGFNDLIRMQI